MFPRSRSAVLVLCALVLARGAAAQTAHNPAFGALSSVTGRTPGHAVHPARGTVLRWEFRPGRTIRYRMRTLQGGAATTHHASTAVVDVETLRARPSGVVEQRLRVSGLVATGHMQRVVRGLRLDGTLGEATVSFARDARGQVVTPPSLDATARSLLQTLELMEPAWPEGPVAVGQSWSVTHRVPLAFGLGMGFGLGVRSTYTLQGLRGRTEPRAVLDVVLHLELGPGSQVSGVPVSGRGEARGRMVVAPSRGQVLYSELAGHIDLVAEAASARPTTRIGFRTTMQPAEGAALVATGHDAGRAPPVPWLAMLGLTMRQSVSRVAAPNLFPHFEMTGVSTFPFDDAHLLDSRHRDAGAVWVTPNARPGAALPLLIYLHGVNRHRIHHRWMHGSERDMRTIIGPMALDHEVGPLAVAVPSTTGDTAQTQRTLYPRFNAAAFVDAVDRSLAARGYHVDRRRVILSGHSAAGCVAGNGFLAGVGSPAVQVLLDIDCCMNGYFAGVLGAAPPSQRVIVAYQDFMWNQDRDYSSFAWVFRRLSAGIDPANRMLAYYRVGGRDAHNDMVQIVLRDWLPRLVPPRD